VEKKVCNQAASSELLAATITPLHGEAVADDAPRKVCISDCSILVVEPALDEMLQLVMSLSRLGMHVTAAVSFAQAKQLLASNAPSIVLTALRLGAYNGLHLVLYGQALRQNQAALVAAADADRSMQSDVEGMGATFLVKPFDHRDLIGAMMQTVFRGPSPTPVRPPYERRSGDRRASSRPVIFDRRRGPDRRQVVWPAPFSTV
jgi:DNA-binding response OmpR family regulator